MPAKEISIKEAKTDKLFYFVANALVYRKEDGRCLLLQRAHTEKAHPGKWATPGGKMEWGDFDLNKPTRVNGEILDFLGSIEDLLRREVKEEAGIELADDFSFINSNTFIRTDGIPVVMVKMAVSYKSGELVLEEGAFEGGAWVTAEESKELDCLDGIQDEIEKTVALYK
jgi:8-oxo-dGTP pyrophosphatase MutT (NUDIX family)